MSEGSLAAEPPCEPSLRCVAELGRTLAELPAQLDAALAADLPARPSALRSVVTTGIGASEPPARLLAALLVEGGVCARFCPTSSFVRGARAPSGALLVSFSQGLSPNALLALGASQQFGERWLLTSVGTHTPRPEKRALRARLEAEGVHVVCLPPADEPAWLVRVAGPTVAALGALRLAAHLLADTGLARIAEAAPRAYRRGCVLRHGEDAPLPSHALALVSLDAPLEGALAHRCKLMEAQLVPEPPVWDVLQFAHGPLQAYYASPLTLLILESQGDDELTRRLMATLDPARHGVRRLIAPKGGLAAMFSHAAAIDQLLYASLSARPRDLYDWPAKRGDGPLYDLGKCP